jgi:ferredoxin
MVYFSSYRVLGEFTTVFSVSRGGKMKVKIDYDLCMGDRNCNKVCPDVFQYDEDQMLSTVLVDVVPAHLEDSVRKAARECAPGAIIVEE